MSNEQQSPLTQWIDSKFGKTTNAKAKEMADLLSLLVIGVAYTSGMLNDAKDLHANYLKLVKSAFSGLYDSGDAGNFHEELIVAVYAHLTGENFNALQAEWAADMEMALVQNRAFFAAQENAV